MTHKQDQQDKDIGAQAGITVGVGLGGRNYAENVKNAGPRGHGFAAEQANHLVDRALLKDAKVVGGDNAKNGPDRAVNGTWIQSKYCGSGAKCIQECFGDDGLFRYLKPDGTPMDVEVPRDMHEAAVQAMQERIKNGKVPGVTDPAEARRIVRKGHITYAQARRIAKAGSIEGLTFDAARGVEIAGKAAGISAIMTFAVSLWRTEDLEVSLKNGALSGIQVGGIAWVSSIGSAQLGRTGVERSLRPATDALVGKLGPKVTRMLVKGAGKNLSGAAASSHLSKLMRGNAVTGAVTVVAMSAGDVVRLFRGQVSPGQLIKNVTVTTASVAGGTGGMMAGAAIGTAIFPGVGTFVGGLLGGLLGGSGSQAVAKAAMDVVIEDDAKKMVAILEKVLGEEVETALLSQKEGQQVIDDLQKQDLPKHLRAMYAATNREEAAQKLITPLIDIQLAKRPKVTLPEDAAFFAAAATLLEEAAAKEEKQSPGSYKGDPINQGRDQDWGPTA